MTTQPTTPNPPHEPCHRCRGCGRIADSERGEPWIDWLELPESARLAVTIGAVTPLPCPECKGAGVSPLPERPWGLPHG